MTIMRTANVGPEKTHFKILPVTLLVALCQMFVSAGENSLPGSGISPISTSPQLRLSLVGSEVVLDYQLTGSGTFSILHFDDLAEIRTAGQLAFTGPSPKTKRGQMVAPMLGTARTSFFVLRENTNQISSRMIWVSPGRFTMGSDTYEAGRESDEGPPHEVTIEKGFWLGKYEATHAEFEEITGDNPSQFQSNGPEFPVEMVSWQDAVQYCSRLTEREQQAGRLPAGYVYRLPTEAEWEYACRAGTATRRHFGDDPYDTEISQYGWHGSISDSTTHRVGLLRANPWGFHDMYGNVFEWCLDIYAPYLDGAAKPNPKGAHVWRGGSWYCPVNVLRSADRHGIAPERCSFLGFRVALAPALAE